jgi:hypothetical protein
MAIDRLKRIFGMKKCKVEKDIVDVVHVEKKAKAAVKKKKAKKK